MYVQYVVPDSALCKMKNEWVVNALKKLCINVSLVSEEAVETLVITLITLYEIETTTNLSLDNSLMISPFMITHIYMYTYI